MPRIEDSILEDAEKIEEEAVFYCPWQSCVPLWALLAKRLLGISEQPVRLGTGDEGFVLPRHVLTQDAVSKRIQGRNVEPLEVTSRPRTGHQFSFLSQLSFQGAGSGVVKGEQEDSLGLDTLLDALKGAINHGL